MYLSYWRAWLYAAGVGAVVWFMKSDVRKSSTMVRQNLKTIRGWLEEAQAPNGGCAIAATPFVM